jgi:hypothetical protein
MAGFDKVYDLFTFRNLIIICVFASIISLAAFSGQFAVTGSSFLYIPLAVTGGSALFFLILMKRAPDIVYMDAVAGNPMREEVSDALMDGRKRLVMFEKDHVAWQWLDDETVHVSQVIEVLNSRMTSHDMTSDDLKRMTNAYESIMNVGNLSIVTVHARKPIDTGGMVRRLERRRDNRKLDADLGGRFTEEEKAMEDTVTLQRVKMGMENAYDSRFFIILEGSSRSLDEAVRHVKDNVSAICERLKDQCALEVAVVKGNKLLEATRFFRVYTALGAPRNYVTSLRTFRNLSLDLGFHTPFAVPRLPPLHKMLRGIYIGRVITTLQPVHWDPYDKETANYHALLVGPSGSGKTVTGKTAMLRAFDSGVPFWVIDPAGDYVDLTRSLGGTVIDFEGSTINPFVLYDRNPVSVARVMTDTITLLAGLRGPERALLQDRIIQAYRAVGVDPTNDKTWTDELSNKVHFRMLYDRLASEIDQKKFSGSAELMVAKSVLHKLQDLALGKYGLGEGTINLDQMFNEKRPICFYVKEAIGENLRRILTWTIFIQLRSLAFTRHTIEDQVRLFVFCDEAHHFVKSMVHQDLPGGRLETPIVDFIREVRKKGIACWLLSQSPQDFLNEGEETSPIFLNVGTTIMLGKADRAYIEFVKRHMNLTDEQAYGPTGLYWMTRHGQGILKKYNDPRAIPVQVEADERALTKTT